MSNPRSSAVYIAGASLLTISLVFLTIYFKSNLSRLNTIKVAFFYPTSPYSLHSGANFQVKRDSIIQSLQQAIIEINKEGGVLGRELSLVIVNSGLTKQDISAAASRMFSKIKPDVVFGCHSYQCREVLQNYLSKHKTLLFFSEKYEGLESRNNIIYIAQLPNQQVIPSIKWAYDTVGKQFYLLTYDSIYGAVVKAVTKSTIRLFSGKLLASNTLTSSKEINSTASAIIHSKPDVVLSFLNINDNIALLSQLSALNKQRSNEGDNKGKFILFSEPPGKLSANDYKLLVGNFIVSSYLGNNPTNNDSEKVPANSQAFDNYQSLRLWANAVNAAGNMDEGNSAHQISGATIANGNATQAIDYFNNHTWKKTYISQFLSSGRLKVVWQSLRQIEPSPTPELKTKVQWKRLLKTRDIFLE